MYGISLNVITNETNEFEHDTSTVQYLLRFKLCRSHLIIKKNSINGGNCIKLTIKPIKLTHTHTQIYIYIYIFHVLLITITNNYLIYFLYVSFLLQCVNCRSMRNRIHIFNTWDIFKQFWNFLMANKFMLGWSKRGWMSS